MSVTKRALDPPETYRAARSAAHAAVQHLTRAARANLAPVADDSHSNLAWSPDGQHFLTHTLSSARQTNRIGLQLAPLRLCVMLNGVIVDECALAGQSVADTDHWLDKRLDRSGLKTASQVNLPYELPDDVQRLAAYPDDIEAGLACLAAWYTLATETLGRMASELAGLEPGPSEVRCWPHHFDIATYVALETGDAETARGVGVGLSPGDRAYDQPYFYVNPWPHRDAAELPAPVSPGHWHTDGFVGSIATADEVLSQDDVATGTLNFLRLSFKAGRGRN